MDPFIGEIRIMSFNFAPKGWASCNGTVMAISQNTALFSLLGTNFGGNGTTTFGLPDLRLGRTVLGAGQGPGLSPRAVGEVGGEKVVVLDTNNTPLHGHAMFATATPADVSAPTAATALARSTGKPAYAPATGTLDKLAATALSPAKAFGQAHNNLMPYQTLNYCISLAGIYPQRG